MENASRQVPLRTLLTWSSPVLVVALLVGVGATRVAHRETPAPTSATSFSSNVPSNGPLASDLRGAVGASDPVVIVPLGTTRPWRVSHTGATAVWVRCGASRTPVRDNIVLAPQPTCQLEISTSQRSNQPWALELLP